jgi:hypothetical protein
MPLLRQALAVIASLAIGGAAGYYFGSGRAQAPAAPDRAVSAAADARVARLEAELETTRVKAEVDRGALELLRAEMADNKEQIAALEEGLLFYRTLMTTQGEGIAEGLSLRDVELVDAGDGRRYAFRIVAQQETREYSTLKGSLWVRIYGLRDGREVSYELAQLSEDVGDEAIALRFRYFQSIEGMLILPDGFEPRGVRLIARARAPRRMEAVAEFPWPDQERLMHVGK